MTTCRDIIQLALGRLRQLRAGESASASEAKDGLTALQSLYDGWVASGLFGRLNDVVITDDYIANEQDRVINDGGFNVTVPMTISNSAPMGTYTPVWPDERRWSMLQTAVERPPRDQSLIEIATPGSVVRLLYSANRRAWDTIDALSLNSPAPLADKGSLGLASCLAEAIADDYGVQVTPGIVQAATLFKWGLSARYDSQRVAGMADYF